MALLSDLPTRVKCTKLEFRVTSHKDVFYYQCDALGRKDMRMSDSVESIENFARYFLKKCDAFKLEINTVGFSFYVKNIDLKKIKTGADRIAQSNRAIAENNYWSRVMS